ncbi:MAG: NUDIX hydrolase [Cypionkella sp.]|jgi:8-oxo-dGTP pyrophosphatase MutT (NUDIX family)
MAVTPATLPCEGGKTCPVQYGAMCWRMHRGKIEVLLITSRDTGRWVIPKGWPMNGREASEAAAQEAWEEAGVRGEVTADSLGIFGYDKVLGPKKAVACQVEVFPLRVHELQDNFPERKQRRRKWFAAKKAATKVNEPELRQLLKDLPGLLPKQPLAQA